MAACIGVNHGQEQEGCSRIEKSLSGTAFSVHHVDDFVSEDFDAAQCECAAGTSDDTLRRGKPAGLENVDAAFG
jgi:hypothetical protein